MDLSVSLHEHLARSAAQHRRLCPRQVLGVRMARFACLRLGIDPAVQRKRIFVYMENGHCVADGVIAVTCASPTNQLMQLLPYGKIAATFVDLSTMHAIRVGERAGCREAALALAPAAASPWHAHLQAYQVMPDEALLAWQTVSLLLEPPPSLGKQRVACSRCGDSIHDHCEVRVDGAVLCKACAYGAYYRPLDPACLNAPAALDSSN